MTKKLFGYTFSNPTQGLDSALLSILRLERGRMFLVSLSRLGLARFVPRPNEFVPRAFYLLFSDFTYPRLEGLRI